MTFRIARSDIPENMIDFEVDVEGTTLTFTVPKFDHITPANYDLLEKWGADKTPAIATGPESNREMIRLHTPKKDHPLVAKITTAQLNAIGAHWAKESGISVGESKPSDDSSGATPA